MKICKQKENCINFINELFLLNYSENYIESKSYEKFGRSVGLEFITKIINDYKIKKG